MRLKELAVWSWASRTMRVLVFHRPCQRAAPTPHTHIHCCLLPVDCWLSAAFMLHYCCYAIGVDLLVCRTESSTYKRRCACVRRGSAIYIATIGHRHMGVGDPHTAALLNADQWSTSPWIIRLLISRRSCTTPRAMLQLDQLYLYCLRLLVCSAECEAVASVPGGPHTLKRHLCAFLCKYWRGIQYEKNAQ